MSVHVYLVLYFMYMPCSLNDSWSPVHCLACTVYCTLGEGRAVPETGQRV
jgi:hypothetical protein